MWKESFRRTSQVTRMSTSSSLHVTAVLTLIAHCMYIAGEPLTKFIKHYERLNYDVTQLLNDHHRTKRSASEILKLDFTAHERDFQLRLRRDTLVFSPSLTVETSEGYVSFDPHRVYVGHVKGDSNSQVHGVLTTSGHFEGSVLVDDEIFIIENAGRYFTRSHDEQKPFHSVIYKHSDIDFDWSKFSCHSDKLHNRLHQSKAQFSSATNGPTTNKTSYSKWMKTEAVRKRTINTTNHTETLVISPSLDFKFSKTLERRLDELLHQNNFDGININSSKSSPKLTYSAESNPMQINSGIIYTRPKRAVSLKENTICELYLQADHLFYERHGSNTETVIEQLTQHVQAVNRIYKAVDFDKDGTPDDVGFVIKRIKIHTDPTAEGYRYHGNFGVEKFLELVSAENYDFVCLAYMFTYRDFEGGTLGLAWTADLHSPGGICDKYNKYQGYMKSLNTGIVTVLNFGQFVPPTVSHVTFAHEIGHNMGSPHDLATTQCSPGGSDGNYIMYARATSGDRPNNGKFSGCSVDNMGPVISQKGRSTGGCFTVYTGSVCGNRVVEDGEECDCGWEEECQEDCCNPQTTSSSSSVPRGCTLKPSAACSPSAGVCCSETCAIVPASQQKLCRAESACQEAAYCNGETFSSACPRSVDKPNKTECGQSSVCFRGACTGSLCEVYGLESCQCSPQIPGDWKDPRLCHLCCKTPEPNAVCKSSHDLNDGLYRLPNTSSQPGSPCNSYRGFCDVFHKCREVDPSGPLQNIRKLFSEETIETLKQWLQTHWYAAVLGGVGIIVFMAIFIKLCSKNTISQKAAEPEGNDTGRRSKLARKLNGLRPKRNRVESTSADCSV